VRIHSGRGHYLPIGTRCKSRLEFWWALLAIIVGTMLGALLIALHATQGPKLGVPQTIQSRGQFGFYGAAFLFPCVLLLNVGFIAAQLVIQPADRGGRPESLRRADPGSRDRADGRAWSPGARDPDQGVTAWARTCCQVANDGVPCAARSDSPRS
jgi:Permease for cytosine/purines, uracil, thiamine, allantoin